MVVVAIIIGRLLLQIDINVSLAIVATNDVPLPVNVFICISLFE